MPRCRSCARPTITSPTRLRPGSHLRSRPPASIRIRRSRGETIDSTGRCFAGALKLMITGTVVTFDPDRPEIDDGVVYIDGDTIEAVSASRRRRQPLRRRPACGRWHRLSRPHRPAQPPRLQLPHAVAGAARQALHDPLPVASRRDLRPRDLQPGAGTRHRGRGAHPPLCRGEGSRQWRNRHPGSPPLTRAFPGWMVRNVEKELFPGPDSAAVSASSSRSCPPSATSFATTPRSWATSGRSCTTSPRHRP